ncbi:MAG: VWA domain-containing protein, partial [Phycisphaerae bacterium]|nr:VWA domain-containing protein [Phycisphaerae bacterium]
MGGGAASRRFAADRGAGQLAASAPRSARRIVARTARRARPRSGSTRSTVGARPRPRRRSSGHRGHGQQSTARGAALDDPVRTDPLRRRTVACDSGMTPISFEQPVWLLLLLGIVPVWWLARRSEPVLGRVKSRISLAVRVVVILLLTASLSRPLLVRRNDGVTSMVVLDFSRSIPTSLRDRAISFVQTASSNRERAQDRVGLVTVAEEGEIGALPLESSSLSEIGHGGPIEESSLEDGVRLALATIPKETANRILLLTDGNETRGSLLAAAEEARAAGVPIDVVPLEYSHDREIVFEELRAPSRARVGQPIEVRMTIRAPNEARGTLRAWVDDEPVDLDPSAPGDGRAVTLRPGPSQFPLPLVFDRAGAHRIRAVFEAAGDSGDGIEENNVGESVVFVSGEGRVLLIDRTQGTEVRAIAAALRRSSIDAEIADPAALAGGAPTLSSFDAVVLANVPRWEIDNDTDRALYSYVHDLGGGLAMLGGDQGFGAGGWIESETAKALPVRLDPPQTRQIMRGALALVMHSCEMPQGNYWGKQVAISAIEALTRLDYCGIVVFDWGAGRSGASWAFPMQQVGDKSGAIAAAKAMQVGDMPDFGPSFKLAYDALLTVKGGVKHAIVISDGDPQAPGASLLNDFKREKITITTVLVVGHGTAADKDKMKFIAESTGGNFHHVQNPKTLPQIFIKEASVISRSLLQEGKHTPVVQPVASGPTKGVTSVPTIEGYVLTVPRDGGMAQIPIVVETAEGRDPLFASWNFGLGRSIAFTSDVAGRWGAAWVAWDGAGAFWEMAIRWIMRPPQPRDASLRASLEGSRGVVELESATGGGGSVEGRVIGPDGRASVLPLRQIGAGRWRGEFDAKEKGAYLVNAGFAVEGEGGEIRTGSIQAAVSVPYAREFRAVRDNAALLEAVSQRTNGRVLRLEDAVSANLFDRQGIAAPLATKRVWDLLAIIAASLFLIDVAARRIAFDTKEAREAAARAMGRVTQAGDASVEAWRKARQRADRRDAGAA